MLGKLIKYEFKATAKIILFSYIALLVIAVINYFAMPWTDTGKALNESIALGDTVNTVKEIFQSLSFIMYILLAVAVYVLTLVITIMRFYKMLGNEGYLMFTLPVTTNQHIFSKLITAVVWNICSIIIVVLSLLIVVGRTDVFSAISDLWNTAAENGVHLGIWLFCFVIWVVLIAVQSLLQFYTAISIGPHITHSRIGGSIIGYIFVYIATQIISGIGALILLLIITNTSYSFDSVTNASETVAMINSMGLTYFLFFVLLSLAISIPGFFVTRHMIDKKLNLN